MKYPLFISFLADCFSMRRLAFTRLVMIGCIMFGGTAKAEYYTWSATFGYNEGGDYHESSNPKAICDLFITRVPRGIFPHFYMPHEDRYWCAITSGSATPSIIIWKKGDSCPPNKTYQNEDPAQPICISSVGAEQKGPPPGCPVPTMTTGNPINFSVGNKFQREIDYQALSNPELQFVRSYNSLDGLWRHGYSTHLRIAEDDQSVALVMSHGKELFFNVSTDGVVSSAATNIGALGKTSVGWQYVSGDNERFVFNDTGKLTHWSNAQGMSQELSHYGNEVKVTDNAGSSLTVTEGIDRQPLSLSASIVQITYGYNTNGRLTSVTRTVGGQTTERQYHYEVLSNPDLLTGITDERGVRYASWSYDDEDRAISSEHAGGVDRVSVAYNKDGSSSVTNELGKKTIYRFQVIQGVKRITAIEGEPSPNCPNSNSTFTYDDRGLLKTKNDNKGNVTRYSYNDRGLETSRTEAAGTSAARTITTEWHPDLFLPVSVTEPDRVTTYTYDDNGRQLSRAVTPR